MRWHSEKKVVYLRPKNRPLFANFIVLLSCLFIGITIFFTYQHFSVKTYTVTSGEVYKSFPSNAIFIKNEIQISSPANGRIQFLVEPGERVRVGTPLFIITTDDVQKDFYQNEIDEIKDKIEILQDDNSNISVSSNLLNKSIEITTEKLRDASYGGEFDKVKAYKDELKDLTKEKQKMLESEETNVDFLKRQLDKLKSDLNDLEIVTYAPDAGIVSFNIDGYENLLIAEEIKDIEPTQFQIAEGTKKNGSIPKTCKINQPMVKIIDNFTLYIAANLEGEMEEGKYYNIIFNEKQKIKGKLTKTNQDGTIGFFLIGTGFEEFLEQRKAKIEIVTTSHKGNIIPKAALFLEEDKIGVYLIERGKKSFKHIEIITENQDEIVTADLKPGDKILVK